METSKKEKTFDAVKMMRDIREKVSAETQNMIFAELKEYIQTKIKESKLKTSRTIMHICQLTHL